MAGTELCMRWLEKKHGFDPMLFLLYRKLRLLYDKSLRQDAQLAEKKTARNDNTAEVTGSIISLSEMKGG